MYSIYYAILKLKSDLFIWLWFISILFFNWMFLAILMSKSLKRWLLLYLAVIYVFLKPMYSVYLAISNMKSDWYFLVTIYFSKYSNLAELFFFKKYIYMYLAMKYLKKKLFKFSGQFMSKPLKWWLLLYFATIGPYLKTYLLNLLFLVTGL
jgi:hypothetical protein